MTTPIKRSVMTIVVLIAIASATFSAEVPQTLSPADFDACVGRQVDIVPWTYLWRADREVQEKPEAYFIPRRLERINKVYRTAYQALPESELKSLYYQMPDLLQPLPPEPKGALLTAALWTGGLSEYQVELHWPAGSEIPAAEAVEVRVYPTAFGWFGWTVDKTLGPPQISQDRRTWTYKNRPGEQMDSAYSQRVDAATEMIAVFCDACKALSDAQPPVPALRVMSTKVGEWQRMNLEIEWGFDSQAPKDFNGRIESSIGLLGSIAPLADDKTTRMSNAHSWKSVGDSSERRGITVSLLCTSGEHLALDTRLTIWNGDAGFTFRPRDVAKGPMLIPAHGVCVTLTGSGHNARQFVNDLAARALKSIRQLTREHREAASWDELMREARLWTCPPGTEVPPFPEVPPPAVQVQVPDPRWTDMWRLATHQLRGKHLWPNLSHEVGRVLRVKEMVGLHAETVDVYDYFLQSPGIKSDGDYSSGEGSLEWAKSMRHDMGYSHEGTHASTGRILLAIAERYFLTGDKEFFTRHRARMQAAADWIIRERKTYMKDIPNRGDLFVVGLMPPSMLGDYALPACDWHWYYGDSVLALQGLQRFADAWAQLDAAGARPYLEEAEAFRRDIRRAAEREAALAPVRRGRDGMYHTYIPRMAYARGLTGPELGAPQFPNSDLAWGSLLLAEHFGVMDPKDYRMRETLDVMEEMGTTPSAVEKVEAARQRKGLATQDAWFWMANFLLPKISHNANVYLLQDEVPSFLRFWMNEYAVIVGSDGRQWEHWRLPDDWLNASRPGDYAPCEVPDNGTAGWFLENYRNMLLMEDGESLWIARGTPRVWLEQGKKITVSNAPTYFGPLSYEITSDIEHGKITAIIEVPSRDAPKKIMLRFRHPKAKPIKTVQVNGQPWTEFDADKETIALKDLTGKATVTAGY